MKLLLVNAINYRRKIETVFPPLGLAYLASSLKKRYPEVQVKIVDRDIENAIKDFRPDAVGVSSVSQNFGRAIEVGKLCKSFNLPVFIGGVHISLLPESLPKAFDFGVYGEGEETILDVINYLSNGGISSGSSEMQKIKGLILHTENGVKLTEERPLITNLDSIPLPERELLNIPKGGATYLFTSRGCPYKCTFCASSRFWDKVRWFSAEYVVSEIEEIVNKYNPWSISFYDDLFIANFNRLEKIVELICNKGLNKKVKFGLACRANLVDDRLVEVLKQLDISMICLGLESGCQKILSYLKGGGITVEQGQIAIELLSKANINVQATFIIGSPDETENEIIQTLYFIKRSKLTDFSVYILTPFPGTQIWDLARERGLVSSEMDWGRLDIEIGDHLWDKIILSEIPRKRLLELYNLFKFEKKKRKLLYVLKTGIKNPSWALNKMVGLFPFKRGC